jgi:glycosyltransferase 2 family protein
MRIVRRGAAHGTGGSGSESFWPRPRIRRPLDVARLLLSAAALTGLVLVAVLDRGLLLASARLPAVRSGVPQTLLSVANVAASFAVLGVLLAMVIEALRWRRLALTSAALACGLGVLGGFLVAVVVNARAGTAAAEVLVGPVGDSGALPVTAAVALVVGADLQRRRWLGPARVALAVAVGCAVALGSLTVPSGAYAVLLGATAGLVVRVVVGVVPSRPPDELVRSVVEHAGWHLTALQAEEQMTGRVSYVGRRPDGEDLRVTVVDPDWRGVPLARRGWRLLRLRTAAVGRPALSLRGQLERQALSASLAESAGVPTARVLALLVAGPALVLVERPLVGARLPEAPAPVPVAESAWCALRQLHDVDLALGAVTADEVVLVPDGRAGFADLAAAQPAATELQRELDVVALLVATAGQLGADEAVAALRSGYGTTPVSEARLAALLQPLALPRPVRHALRGTPLLDELRTAVTGPGSTGAIAEPARLERLRPRTVVSIVAGTVAAYVLATQLSSVDIAGALTSAQPTWLAVALLGAAFTFLGSALTRIAFTSITLPLARTMLVQLASSFLTLVTPPAVGHVGLNIRYLQRMGVPTAAAAATVTVSEAVTIAVTVLLLLACGWLSGVSESRLALLPSGNVLAVLVVAAAILAVVAAAPPTRRLLYRRLQPLVRSTLPQLVATASEPRRLGTALLGVLVLNGGNILALDASLRAFSASLAVPTLVVVYLAASALGSAAPTPGGLGAVEAALVGGLTATGVPLASALPAVLAFRTATFWLPAPLGWGAFFVLQRRGWI